ncbi:MAG: helix-hairpin-helix domain-containing protein [Bacteroidales bacterium]
MSWKDYFYYTKTERNGIIVLFVLILLVIFLPFTYPYIFKSEAIDFSDFDRKVRESNKIQEEYLAALESAKASSAARSYEKEKEKEKEKLNLTPFVFNPNTLGKNGFEKMGLPEWVINNIVNYREAGGRFRYREQLKNIYTIDDELYAQLEDFIDLPKEKDIPVVNPQKISHAKDTFPSQDKPVRFADVVIEMNTSDTLKWQKLRGIGPVFSKRIVAYRELLGGYYDVNQLMEVYGMDSVRYNQILPHLEIDTLNLRKIDLNTADFVTLVRHPYLNRNQVNSILKIRQTHGNYEIPSDIKKSHLISDSLYNKIRPYLSVQ